MSRIRSRNTLLEILFFKKLSSVTYKLGYRYRKHYKKLPGSPDIVFVGKKLAIFIDGDFWHGYNFLKLKKVPPGGYWRKKIISNIERDKRINRELRKAGWKVLRFWEHELEKKPEVITRLILHNLKKRGLHGIY